MEWKAFKKLITGEELTRREVSLLLRVAENYSLRGLENEIGHLEMGVCRNCKLGINWFNRHDRCYVRYAINEYVTCWTHCVKVPEEGDVLRLLSQ